MADDTTRRNALLTLLGGRRERPPRDDRNQPDEKARLKAAYLTYDLVARDSAMGEPR